MENQEINKYLLRKKNNTIKRYEINNNKNDNNNNNNITIKKNQKAIFFRQKSVMESAFENIHKYKKENKIKENYDEEEKIEEDSIFKKCKRFPHRKECFCEEEIDNENPFEIIEVYPNIFIGHLSSAITKEILKEKKITHILNVSSTNYYQDKNIFEYFNLDAHNNHDEDIKKYFRLTNRFIQEALVSPENNVLIHGYKDLFRPICFYLVFKIGLKNENLKKCYNEIKLQFPNLQVNDYFIKQLEFYDLEKLAVKKIKKE